MNSLKSKLHSLGLATARKISKSRLLKPPVRACLSILFKANEGKFLRRFRQLPEHVDNPVCVKIGANDGLSGDLFGKVLREDSRWRGVFIEPDQDSFEQLSANFPDRDRFHCVNCAVGAIEEERSFYYLDPKALDELELPEWVTPNFLSQLSSFNPEHTFYRFHPAVAKKLRVYLRETKVRVRPIQSILKEAGVQKIDFLHIDTEGHDWEILKPIDLNAWEVKLCSVEWKFLNGDESFAMLQKFREAGFKVLRGELDYLAIREH